MIYIYYRGYNIVEVLPVVAEARLVKLYLTHFHLFVLLYLVTLVFFFSAQDEIASFEYGTLRERKTLTSSPWSITQIGSTTSSFAAVGERSFLPPATPPSKFGTPTR